MRITVRVPDDLGEDIKSRTDNVSAYVTEALREKIGREKRYEARKRLLKYAGKGEVDPDIYDLNKLWRYEGDRDLPAHLEEKKNALRETLEEKRPDLFE
jgi:Arc/MetJ-type ribon-helix-helix transcriptional regulator